MALIPDFNVFVGAETGLFKGINVDQQTICKNLNSMQALDRGQEITCLSWGNKEETEVLIGLRCQKVRIYDTDFKGFSGCLDVPLGEGPLRGVGRSNESVVTAAESGHVKLWRFKGSEQVQINALNSGETLSRMRVSPQDDNIIATGGKKNDLQLWDLTNSQAPIFRAKNVKNDMLDLTIPVWVSDIAFVPNSEQVATCSRHGYVRLYDQKSGARRPVVNIQPEEQAWTAIGITSRPNQIIVGSGKGRMLLVDLRQKKAIHAYRGFTGGIREVFCHPKLPFVVSVGLDRFLRIHHYDSQTPIKKLYLKSRLNAVLVRRDFQFVDNSQEESVQVVEKVSGEDALWKDMEVITETVPRKIRKRKA